MFGCFRSQKLKRASQVSQRMKLQKTDSEILPQKKIIKEKVFVKQAPIILNGSLDPRDERILIPFNRQFCSTLTILDEVVTESVTEWLVQVNYVINSRGFLHRMEGRLTQIQSKTYSSKNILLNIKELMGSLTGMRQQLKQELMVKINAVQTQILSELMLKYPQSGLRGASKRIRNIVRKIDNRHNNEYDFLYKNQIVFNYRADGHYASDVMRALNKIISFANEVYQPDKGNNESQDSYFQIWAELIEYLVMSDGQNNEKKFFEGFDFIYDYENSIEQFPFNDKTGLMNEKIKGSFEMSVGDAHQKKLKISHKIPIEANLFSEEEIESGECKIRNSSVLRVIAKWTYELLQKLTDPKQLILQRAQKFKMTSKKLYSLQNNQKLALYQAATKQRQRIQQYISQLKRQYIFLQTLFASQKTKNSYTGQDADIQAYALKIREVYSQCLFKLLCRLISSLKKVPREASEIFYDRYRNEMSQDELNINYEILRQVDLVSFKIGDLIRARYSSSESDFLRFFRNLNEVNEKRPEIFKIIRIKNRLDHKENDILVNVFFMGKVQCQLQLNFDRTDEEDAKKGKLYASFNHFLYEIRRSLLGPIGEFACILGEHDPVISQYVLMDKNNTMLQKNVLLQQMPNNQNNEEAIKRVTQMFLGENLNNSITQRSSLNDRQITKSLRQIHELLFLCERCGQFKKSASFSLLAQRKIDKDIQNELQHSPKITECKSCFLAKLQESTEENRIHYLLDLIFGLRRQEDQIYYKHLRSWDQKAVPIRFREDELYKYLPREGFMLSKDSLILNFHYFRTFMDEDFIYFASKMKGQINILAKISKILSQDDILLELRSIQKKYFIFRLDSNVIIEDGSTFGFGKVGQFDAGFCKRQCLQRAYGVGVRNRMEIIQLVNQQVSYSKDLGIVQDCDVFKQEDGWYSSYDLGSMINEVVMEDKRFDRACRAVAIIEAEDSHLSDIRFTYKMINLSDIYIRYNNELKSLKGIEQCRNLKILYCNQCKIESLSELSGLIMLQQLFINENQIHTLEGLERCTSLKEFSCFCNKISTVEPLRECMNLAKLDIGYNLITQLTPISSLSKLKSLATSKNNLKTLDGIETLFSLQVIDFSHTFISDPGLLDKCPQLQKIYCSNTKLISLADIRSPNLLQLDVGECHELVEFDLSRVSCQTLQKLTVDRCLKLQKLKNIQFCSNLKEFLLQENLQLLPEEFLLIGKCHKIESLNISGNKSVNTLFFLGGLPKLNKFTCSRCEKLSNISFVSLKKCADLQTLNISYNLDLFSVQFLKSCSNIQHLNLSGTGIQNFDNFFSKLQELKYLQLRDMHELEIFNFQFLKDAIQIEKIVIDEIQDILSLKGIQKMAKLKQLSIGKMRKNDSKRFERLEKEIIGFPIKIQRRIRFQSEIL